MRGRGVRLWFHFMVPREDTWHCEWRARVALSWFEMVQFDTKYIKSQTYVYRHVLAT